MERKLNLATALRSAGLAVALGLLASAAPAQVLPPAPDCKPGRPPCDEWLKVTEALERYRVAYLGVVGACGKEDACVPRIKPNAGGVGSQSLSRVFEYSLDACKAACSEQFPKEPLKRQQCEAGCTGTATTLRR